MSEDPYIQQLFAKRIGGSRFGKDTSIYKFEKIKRAKQAAKAERPETPIIDMGVGEPDEMAFPEIVKALQSAVIKPENRGYADNGGNRFKISAAKWMKDVFGVEGLDPESEIVHSIGSKAALSILPKCFINSGDVVIMTSPGYPVFGTHAKYLGGEVYNLPITEENQFLPQLETIPENILARAKAIVVNYPNNPTGASATRIFFENLVAFAKTNELIVVQDAAYSALIFEGEPLSFLQIPGAKDVGVELHSHSKGFNMTGWRIGFVVGNPLIVKAYATVKDNSDSGQFLAIQEAGATALENPWITEKIATKYSRRMDFLVKALNELGFLASKPKGSFFLYTRAPKAATVNDNRTEFETGEDFSQWLIRNELISTVPWDDAGSFVRFSVTFEADGEENERQIVDEIRRRLGKYNFDF